MRKALRSMMSVDGRRCWVRLWFGLVLAACVLTAILIRDGAQAMGAQAAGQPARTDNRFVGRAPVGRQSAIARGSSKTDTRTSSVLPGDNMTLRPTVVVRRGTSQGSGTIIASIEGEALVLTAAHVVKAPGPIFVELHRYNIGRERAPATPGSWPRAFQASLAAADTAADLAVLRIENLGALPYVARLAPDQGRLVPDSTVTSVGIDLGAKLTSWTTQLVKTVRFELNGSHSERLFFITTNTPEHGRSGGGLFLANGELVGVCVGHAALFAERRMGVFASRESIRQLLDDHDQLSALIVRSERRKALVKGHSTTANPAAQRSAPANLAVTPTQSVAAKLHIQLDDGP
jgi:S1-C subfamily serine protease